MDNISLKSAFFGFSKTSVCEYIAQINQEFHEKLFAAAEESKKERETLKEKIDVLEKELSQYKKVHGDISNALLEAQQHAAELKAETEKENERIRSENARKCEEQTRRLESYRAEIDILRQGLACFAAETYAALKEQPEKMKVLQDVYVTEEGTLR